MNKISFIMTIGLMFGNQICPNSDETISVKLNMQSRLFIKK